MRYIPLKSIEMEDGTPPFEYAEAIRSVIRQPLNSANGVNIEEMRKGIRILDKLDAATDILELEDADYEHLKEKIVAMKWGMVDRTILGFIDTILDATQAGSNGLIQKDAARVS